jgi:hypothetical protein
MVHDIDRFFAIRDADVNVESENEIGARDLLHVFDDVRVALVRRDQLVHPMRKWMRAGRSNHHLAFALQNCALFIELASFRFEAKT